MDHTSRPAPWRSLDLGPADSHGSLSGGVLAPRGGRGGLRRGALVGWLGDCRSPDDTAMVWAEGDLAARAGSCQTVHSTGGVVVAAVVAGSTGYTRRCQAMKSAGRR